VEVNNDLFVAGKVYEGLKDSGSDQFIPGAQQIKIHQGNVVIPKEMQEAEKIDPSKIRQLKGVKNVRVGSQSIQK